MKDLLEEGSEFVQEVEKGPIRDAGLIASAQKVERYEIADMAQYVPSRNCW